MLTVLMLILTQLGLLAGVGLFSEVFGLSPLSLAQHNTLLLCLSGLLLWSSLGALMMLLGTPLILRFFGASWLSEPANHQELWALTLLNRQARQLGIPPPAVALIERSEFNAFTVGVLQRNSCIVLSRGLLESLNQEELEAVFAHELAHIRQGEMRTLSLMLATVYLVTEFPAKLLSGLLVKTVSGFPREGVVYYAVYLLCQIAVAWPASLLVGWYSRQCEYQADSRGAEQVGRGKMIAALQCLRVADHGTGLPDFLLAFGKSATLWQRLGRLFSSHPSLEERLIALRKKA